LSNIYLKSGQLESVLPDWKPNGLNIYALYSSRKHLSPAVRAFIDHSEDYFKQHPW
ncbi:LysR family transcriptional regulator, partial [Vibrio alginolyticus]|nr:LysR family transcriptional regulator [Vibrio alginolyticus]